MASYVNCICYNIKYMAQYKVPQDVEADDKLIGPFSFRQFCYLLIAFAAGGIAFVLGKIAIPLAIIPLPVIVLFFSIALPLRKDQPTEIYLAAMVRYYLVNAKHRIWVADGEETNVIIGVPVAEDSVNSKDIKADEVSRRLSFLANITDTQGWSSRGVDAPINNNLNDDFIASTQNVTDVMDANASRMDNLLDKSSQKQRTQVIQRMQSIQTTNAPTPTSQLFQPISSSAPKLAPKPAPLINPNKLPNYNYQPVVNNGQPTPAAPPISRSVSTAPTSQPVAQQPIVAKRESVPTREVLPSDSKPDIIKPVKPVTNDTGSVIDIELH